jgi:hypothetical protein
VQTYSVFVDLADGTTLTRNFTADIADAVRTLDDLIRHEGWTLATGDAVRLYNTTDDENHYRANPPADYRRTETVPPVDSVPVSLDDSAPVDSAPVEATPRVTRKVCQRPGCGAECARRYYVHTDTTAPDTRRLWCGACLGAHAITLDSGIRWALTECVRTVAGASVPRHTAGALQPCPHCDRYGSSYDRGVFVDVDGTMSDRCRGCIGSVAVVAMPRDPTDTVRQHRWVHRSCPSLLTIRQDSFESTIRVWEGDYPQCPGCGVLFQTARLWRDCSRPVAMLSTGDVGPTEVRLCNDCRSIPRTGGDQIDGYHHTVDVQPCHLDVDGDVIRAHVAPSDANAPGDRGYLGRRVPATPGGFSSRRVPARVAPWYAGVELEIATDGVTPAGVIARSVRQQIGDLWAESKRDSSVGPDGVEVVTHPGTIGAHRATWSTFKAPHGAVANSTCGMHVHVARDALSPGQIDRLAYMLSRPGDTAAWSRVFRREPNSYCRLYRPGAFARRLWRDDVEKYRVLNLSPRHTIEFRWPAGTVRGSTILATVEIIHALCLYTAPGSAGASHRPDVLSWSAFATWMTSDPFARSETRTARAYLARRGLITGRKPAPGTVARVDDGTDTGIGPDEVAPGEAVRTAYATAVAARYPST